MYQLILKPSAILMVKEAYTCYELQHKGLGEMFLSALDICYKKIQLYPTLNGKIQKHYRQVRIKKFPYIIVYEIIKNDIVVLAVFHTKRNPINKLNK